MSERFFLVAVWLPVFVFLHVFGSFLVLALDPAGLDACDTTAGSAHRGGQTATAFVAILAPAALALWRLRSWRLVVSLSLLVPGVLWWTWLLDDACP